RDDGNGLTLENGLSVGVYVGYDDNKPMRRGSTRITGSQGALPAWTTIIADIVARQAYAASLDPVDLSFNGLTINRPELGQKNLAINDANGGVLSVPLRQVDPHDRYQPAILTFGSAGADRTFEAERNVVPFWSNDVSSRPDQDTSAQPAHLSGDVDLTNSR
ncbi:MAG: hypothetical protein IH612_05230, partial [Desulfofustis sp.]|nr:hypothetical protein [Desulfofustis sp.]